MNFVSYFLQLKHRLLPDVRYPKFLRSNIILLVFLPVIGLSQTVPSPIDSSSIDLQYLGGNTVAFDLTALTDQLPPPLQFSWSGKGHISRHSGKAIRFEHHFPAPGTYTYQLDILDGAQGSHQLSGKVHIAKGATAHAGKDVVLCAGETHRLGSLALKNHTYSWSPSIGLDHPDSAMPVFKARHEGTQPDTLYFSLKAKKGKHIGYDYVRIIVWPKPEANLRSEQSSLCAGEAAQLYASGGSQYLWDLEASTYRSGNMSTQSSNQHRFEQSGQQTISIAAVNDGGCKDTASAQFEVYPQPEADFRVEHPCLGDSSLFVDQSTISSGNISRISWEVAGVAYDTSFVKHRFEKAGLHAVKLSVYSDKGCVSNLLRRLEIEAPPVLPMGIPDTLCVGDRASLSIVAQPTQSFSWYRHPADPEAFHTGLSIQTTPLTTDSTFFVLAESASGCKSGIAPITAYVQAPQRMAIISSADELFLPDATVEFRLGSHWAIRSWHWELGAGKTSNQSGPIHTYQQAGTYPISLEVLSERGCQIQLQHEIVVKEVAGISLPRAFSPNGDGTNDLLEVRHFDIATCHLQIYNMQGQLVYESTDIEEHWDGLNLSGKPVKPGLYFCKIKARTHSETSISQEQRITVIR